MNGGFHELLGFSMNSGSLLQEREAPRDPSLQYCPANNPTRFSRFRSENNPFMALAEKTHSCEICPELFP